MLLLIFIAIIPVIILGIIIYNSDKKEKEPIKNIILAFLLGIVSIIITLLLSFGIGIDKIDTRNLDTFNLILYCFIEIALIEELSKWICSYLSVFKNKNFNYTYDGIVYFSFVALGFACVENILYAVNANIGTIIFRGIATVPAHVFFGITSGYYYILSVKEKKKNNRYKKNIYLLLSIIVPTILHGFYDFCLLKENYFFFVIYLIFIVSLYFFVISNAKSAEHNDHPLE